MRLLDRCHMLYHLVGEIVQWHTCWLSDCPVQREYPLPSGRARRCQNSRCPVYRLHRSRSSNYKPRRPCGLLIPENPLELPGQWSLPPYPSRRRILHQLCAPPPRQQEGDFIIWASQVCGPMSSGNTLKDIVLLRGCQSIHAF